MLSAWRYDSLSANSNVKNPATAASASKEGKASKRCAQRSRPF